MKRVLAVLMLVALILCAGCGGKAETTEEKLKQQLPELLENELEIEGIYRGGGLTTENAAYTPDENGQCFVRVTDEDYPTVAVLKEKTEQVFTPAYAEENLYSYAFSGDWPRYEDIDGALHMDVNQGGGLDREWNTAEFQILEEKEDGVLVQVEYMTYGSRYLAEMTLVPQEDGTYRIDTFTYGIEAK